MNKNRFFEAWNHSMLNKLLNKEQLVQAIALNAGITLAKLNHPSHDEMMQIISAIASVDPKTGAVLDSIVADAKALGTWDTEEAVAEPVAPPVTEPVAEPVTLQDVIATACPEPAWMAEAPVTPEPITTEASADEPVVVVEATPEEKSFWQQVGRWVKTSPSDAWKLCCAGWSRIKAGYTSVRGWTVPKAKKAWDTIADFFVARYQWTREVALAWVKAKAKASWTGLSHLVVKGAKGTWQGLCVSYDWTKEQVVDAASWTWNGMRTVADKVCGALGKATDKTVGKTLDHVFALSFPHVLRVTVPAAAVIDVPHTIRERNSQWTMADIIVLNQAEYQHVLGDVQACGGTSTK